MNMLTALLVAFTVCAFVYFVVLNGTYLVLTVLAWSQMRREMRSGVAGLAITDAGANEAQDRVADGLAHAAHLAVATPVERDAQRVGGHRRHLRRRGGPVVELDPFPQGAQGPPRRGSLHLGEVLLLDAVAGMGDALGQLTVVGEQQQTLGVEVEAPDREHPRLTGHEVEDGGPALRVAGSRDDLPPGWGRFQRGAASCPWSMRWAPSTSPTAR